MSHAGASPMNMPKLRFPDFSGAWQRLSLSDVASIFDGTHQTPIYTESGVKFLSVENIEEPEASRKFISELAYNRDFKIKIRPNDILMTRITAGIIGATALIRTSEPLAFYVSLALIRTNDIADSRFIEKYIATNQFKRELHKRIIHVAFPKKINLGDIGKCEVAIPTIPEQQKIAEFLGMVNTRVGLLRRRWEALAAYKKAMMQLLFARTLRFTRSDGSPFPDWQEKRLGEIATIRKGEQLNRDTLSDECEFPVINGGKTASGYADQWNTEANVITLSEGGNSCGYVDWQSKRFWLGGHCYAILPTFSDLSNSFLFQALKSTQAAVMRLRVGSGLPNIQKGDLSKLSLGIPHVEEQQKIAEFLSELDIKINTLAIQTVAMKRFKKGLLQQMFV